MHMNLPISSPLTRTFLGLTLYPEMKPRRYYWSPALMLFPRQQMLSPLSFQLRKIALILDFLL